MTRCHRIKTIPLVLAISGLLVLLPSCSEKGPAERLGERIDSAVESMTEELDEVAKKTSKRLDEAAKKTSKKLDEAAKKTSEKLDEAAKKTSKKAEEVSSCLLYTSPSPRDRTRSRMPSSA